MDNVWWKFGSAFVWFTWFDMQIRIRNNKVRKKCDGWKRIKSTAEDSLHHRAPFYRPVRWYVTKRCLMNKRFEIKRNETQTEAKSKQGSSNNATKQKNNNSPAHIRTVIMEYIYEYIMCEFIADVCVSVSLCRAHIWSSICTLDLLLCQ